MWSKFSQVTDDHMFVVGVPDKEELHHDELDVVEDKGVDDWKPIME